MKRLLILFCLLLCGCARTEAEIETEVPAITAATVPETEPVTMYAPNHPLEEENRGALRVYPLTLRKVNGMQAMGDDLVVFSGQGCTTLTLLTGRKLSVAASLTLEHELTADDPSVRAGNGTLSYFDSGKQETVVLDDRLKEVSRIAVTEALSGSPILSSDRNTLYYCTAEAILAWDLETGIHRTVKELCYEEQTLTGLHLNDTVLQCRIRDGETVRTLFLAADTGRLLSQQEGDVTLHTDAGRYYAELNAGSLKLLVFGGVSASANILYPEDLAAKNFFLPEDRAVITASDLGDSTLLSYYDLETGLRRAELSLPALQTPKTVLGAAGDSVYLLAYDPEQDCDTIYQWEVPDNTTGTKQYTDTYLTEDSVNSAGLDQCRAYAAELSDKYGFRICVGQDALAVQPWDYEFEAEYLYQVLQQELTLLDQRLSQFPQEVLEKTVSHFSSMTVCLVRQITGTAESGSLDTATGIQFLEGTDAYVVISVGQYSEQALYHELFHVMETHILDKSIAFDQWEELNPAGFEYHYGSGAATDAAQYLTGDARAFIDEYAMSFPKEDRARIMENAILPGNEALFRSPILQAKLVKLCEGIRQAYGLRKSPEVFVWEQYLSFPIAYSE